MPDEDSATPAQVHAAATGFKAAIDAHLAAVEARAGENDPHVQAAYDALASAGEAYDDALFSAYEEVTPFGPVDADDEDDEDDETEDDVVDSDDLVEWDAPETE
jgi:hypothetical protein